MTDVIADMLTRIRNALMAKHETVEIPASNTKKAIADILLREGYIAGVEIKSGSINTLISKEIVSTCDLEIKVKVVETEIYENGLEITKEKEKLVSKKGYAITKVGSKVAD